MIKILQYVLLKDVYSVAIKLHMAAIGLTTKHGQSKKQKQRTLIQVCVSISAISVPRNLALHKAVNQSSTYTHKLSASLAVDGDLNICTKTMEEPNPFRGVYLPVGFHIKRVSIILNETLYEELHGHG